MDRSKSYYRLKLRRDELWWRNSEPLNLQCANDRLWRKLKLKPFFFDYNEKTGPA